ncbi:MAG: membrane integrity-associated transporter subunit PqiC [Defluviicoccus sp.]|nr:MAG: membrane integrity-associated transporter subunit PqiC [Defluviicoccus sp.]
MQQRNPTTYYTLAAESSPANTPAPASARRGPAIVALGPVQMPDYLDRPQIVVRETDYRLHLATTDVWAAPLSDMVPRVLIDDLSRRLPGTRVVGFPQVSGPNFEYRVSVDITRFDVDAEGTATLAARWQIYPAASTRAVVVEDSTAERRSSESGYPAAVAALSGTLADLSDRIAQTLITLPVSTSPADAR